MKIKKDEIVYIALNKPKGYVCALKDNTAPTIMKLINGEYKGLHIVGRLDKDTTGLIILTNDGSYTHKVTHPKKHVRKIYEVTLEKEFVLEDKLKIEQGMTIDHGKTKLKPGKVEIVKPNLIKLEITEGKFHQVKKMMSALNNKVTNLHRIQFDNLELKDLNLKNGEWKEIKLT